MTPHVVLPASCLGSCRCRHRSNQVGLRSAVEVGVDECVEPMVPVYGALSPQAGQEGLGSRLIWVHVVRVRRAEFGLVSLRRYLPKGRYPTALCHRSTLQQVRIGSQRPHHPPALR